MQDHIEMPSVVTPFKVGGFTLYVYAYRRLSPREGAEMVRQYLMQKKLRKLPKSGSGKLITVIGFDETNV